MIKEEFYGLLVSLSCCGGLDVREIADFLERSRDEDLGRKFERLLGLMHP